VRIAACVTAAVAGVAVAAFAGGQAYAGQTRQPTRAELSAAAAAGVAQRWERVPAGQIFPAAIRYSTDLQTRETATRIGVDPRIACAQAVGGTLLGAAERDGCVAGVRADYTDQLAGSVYTVGILAFPTVAKADAFYASLPVAGYPPAGLRALAIPETAAALFDDAARQASTAQPAGPYVVLAVAGYADGRPANAGDERRDSVFDPASQLVSAIAAPLAKPVTVRCGTTEWACDMNGGQGGQGGQGVPAIPPPPPDLAQIRPEEMKTLGQIQAPVAWRSTRGNGVTVAVLDTGVAATAPDLAGSVRVGPDYTAGADPPGYQPPHIHGTYIASLIAGHGSGPNDTLGVVGVAPRARILSIRVILDDGEPGVAAYNEDPRYANAIGKGIYYAVAHGATVINLSLGSQQPTAYLRTAIAYAITRGVVVVASAGNDGTSAGFAPYVYPASFSGVIAVAAVTGGGERASFSEQNAAVVLAAPGVGVIGAGPSGEYFDAEGTSPAAALVSGVAALIKSRYPGLSPALVEQALITSAARRPPGGYSTATGFGEVDAPGALAAAARLAAARPAPGLAPAARFAAAADAGSGPPPIEVVHRDETRIAAYTGAAAGGAVCAVVALVLAAILVRRARRTPPAPEPGPPPMNYPDTPNNWFGPV
jgi:subtilisin family serine protease